MRIWVKIITASHCVCEIQSIPRNKTHWSLRLLWVWIGVTKLISSVPFFPIFYVIPSWFPIEYHVHIKQAWHSRSDICQISMWPGKSSRQFCILKNIVFGEINKPDVSSPTCGQFHPHPTELLSHVFSTFGQIPVNQPRKHGWMITEIH